MPSLSSSRWKVAVGMLVCALGAASAAARPETVSPASDAVPFSLQRFRPDRRAAQLSYEQALKDSASANSLSEFHATLASEPHMAGSLGDLRVIEFIGQHFQSLGLETETHWIWPYLSRPIAAQLEIVSPTQAALNVTEPPVEGDPYSADPRLTFGFNAFSGSGDVTGEVVYANFGTKADFERLAELGVDVTGRIAIARYGGNFRGYKAKYAEQAGAIGLIIYTDPAESGYMRGLMYPEGGWATDQQIQRGSLATLVTPGDPLTPMQPATENAERVDPESVGLPRIPVQPIGWAAAQQIMSQMTGDAVPDKWQGAMPFAYRLTGGRDLRVRLKVQQARQLTKTANVVGTLRGARFPDEWIIVGCHHDAWGFGASDPLAGTILIMETAQRFAELAASGQRPDRSILFATWAAEEHGIIGSVEWVEAHREQLLASAVAYINLDMAAMGPLLGASGTPSLRELILDAARATPQARNPEITAYDQWLARTPPAQAVTGPQVGSMGGGSDHIGFYFHVAAPTMSFGASGGRGTSYHSNYDNLHWYRKVVGDDYEPALMLARVVSVAVARLANADVLPMDPTGYAPDLRRHLANIEELARKHSVSLEFDAMETLIADLERASLEFNAQLSGAVEGSAARDSGARTQRMAQVVRGLEANWYIPQGLPERPWYRSLYMASDETSGYSAWPIPGLRKAVEEADVASASEQIAILQSRIAELVAKLDRAASP